jgi:hypothetical protein
MNPKAPTDFINTCLNDVEPFTITFRTAEETAFLFNAVMRMVFGDKNSEKIADIFSSNMQLYGDEKGILKFKEQAKERGFILPEWFAPLWLHIAKTTDKNRENILNEVRKANESETETGN